MLAHSLKSRRYAILELHARNDDDDDSVTNTAASLTAKPQNVFTSVETTQHSTVPQLKKHNSNTRLATKTTETIFVPQ